MIRTWWSVVVASVLLSGCAGVAQPIEAPVEAPLENILVRLFVDDVDGDGVREVHIRFAGQVGSDVRPFTGDVDILMFSGESRGWRPQVWELSVSEHQFVDAVLPYYEVTQSAARIAPGQEIEVRVDATLPDGRLIVGKYVTWA